MIEVTESYHHPQYMAHLVGVEPTSPCGDGLTGRYTSRCMSGECQIVKDLSILAYSCLGIFGYKGSEVKLAPEVGLEPTNGLAPRPVNSRMQFPSAHSGISGVPGGI